MDFIRIMLRRELLVLPRRRYFYLRRGAVPAVGGAIVLIGYLVGQAGKSGSTGLAIFNLLGALVLGVAAVIAPYNAADRLLQERRDYTMGLLFLGDVRAETFLVGTLLTTFMATVLVLVATVPLLLLGITLGGLTATQLLQFFLLLLSTVYLGAGLGLALGACLRRQELLYLAVLVTVLLVYLGLPLAARAVLGPAAVLVSPFHVFQQIVRGQVGPLAYVHSLVAVVAGTLLLVPAALLLPRRLLDDTAPRQRRTASWSPRVRAALARSRNPVTWRDFHYAYGGWRTALRTFLLGSIAFLAVLPLVLKALGKWPAGNMARFEAMTAGYTLLAAANLVIGFIVRAGRMFARERAEGTLGLLLTSDLSEKRIMQGKLQAVYLPLLPWFAVLAVGTYVSVAAASSVWAAAGIVAGAVGATFWWYVFTGIVIWLSLYLDDRSMAQAYGVLAVAGIVGPLVMLVLSFFVVPVVGVFALVVVGWLLRRDATARLRGRAAVDG